MDFTTAVGRKLAKQFRESLHSGETAEEAGLRLTLGAGISRANRALARMANRKAPASSRDAARIARCIEEIAFQTNVLAIHAALHSSETPDSRPTN